MTLSGVEWATLPRASIAELQNRALVCTQIDVPALLWLTWCRNADGARDDSHLSFHDWAVGDFDTLTGPVKGANATVEVLLPIAAVAVGMTVLGLVFHIIASAAA
jgi:hypothetical protein